MFYFLGPFVSSLDVVANKTQELIQQQTHNLLKKPLLSTLVISCVLILLINAITISITIIIGVLCIIVVILIVEGTQFNLFHIFKHMLTLVTFPIRDIIKLPIYFKIYINFQNFSYPALGQPARLAIVFLYITIND